MNHKAIILLTASIGSFLYLTPAAARDFTGGPFKAGCAQFFVTGDVQANLEKILAFISKADSQEVDILVFPETALSGYAPRQSKDYHLPGEKILKEALERVCRAARETETWLVLGTSTYEEDELYNTVLFIDDRGEIRAAYSKTQLTSGDAKVYQPGKTISTFQVGRMKFGMEICYDIRFPEPWRIQALEGAQVIFHAAHAAGNSSWKIPVWEGHLRSRAAENGIWVVSCNTAGPIQMGKSYIIDPDGLVIAQSNQDNEELITGMVDLSKSNRGKINNRRRDLYRLIPAEDPQF